MTPIPLSAFTDNYIWTLVNEKKQTMICVDPGDAFPVIQYAKAHQYTVTALLITHHHFDHAGGIADLKRHFPDLAVYAPKDSRIAEVNHPQSNGMQINLDRLQFEVLETPGHTRSHICFFEPNQGWLFCGDTLFSAGCGRVFDGTIRQLYDSLKRLQTLPEATKVFCGHEYTFNNLRFAASIEPDNQDIQRYKDHLSKPSNPCSLPSTIELEKKINPFFRAISGKLSDFSQKNKIAADSPLTVFKHLRERKDAFS